MAVLRTFLVFAGGLMVLAGCFFALQGAGVIMWPPESFMLANRGWVTKGLIIAFAGAAVLLLGRRVGRSA